MSKKIMTTAILLALVSGFLFSQTPAPTLPPVCPCATLPGSNAYSILYGIVRDSSNSVPIGGAAINYSATEFGYGGSGTSYTTGSYSITLNQLPCTAPANRITASATGYLTKEINNASVGACSYSLLNIALDPATVGPTPVPASEYSISGSAGSGSTKFPNITIRLTGTVNAETSTDANGNYVFSGLVPGGAYTVEPIQGSVIPPVVTFTSPAANAILSGTVTVSSTITTGVVNMTWYPRLRNMPRLYADLANEDFSKLTAGTSLGISSATLYVDGIAYQQYATGNFDWNTSSVANGPHLLRITAEDTQHNIGSSEIGVNVDNSGKMMGDTNGDRMVDIIDALLIAQYYIGLAPVNFDVTNADVNCSGVADIIDALLVAKYYTGIISTFPCEPEATAIPAGGYVIHVRSERTNVERIELNVPVSYTGDYSSTSLATPFDIGPYPAPFTVTLNAPFTYYYNSKLLIISGFRSEGSSYSGSTATYIADDTRPENTVYAQYYEDLAATPTPTPSSTAMPAPK